MPRPLLLCLAGSLLVSAAPAYEPAHYDLSALPVYVPKDRVVGTIRIYGTPLEDLVGEWLGAFQKLHGQIREHAYLINTSQAFAGLVTGLADIGVMGHRQWRNGFAAFEREYGYDPLEIRFASGSYDDPAGTTPGLMFIVNQHNPLAGLTLEQIDGIYGAQRTGGWIRTKWSTAAARGPEKNIRRWGQLGLNGDWASQPIHPLGSDVTISNWADLMNKVAMQGGTKWNPALVEAPRADISTKAQGKTRDQLILEAVENDPDAIGFIFKRVIDANHGDVRILPLAAEAGGPYVAPSAQTFFDGTYPMHNGAYLYLNRPPGQPVSLREKEFVKFVLSRQGQEIIAANRLFVPLDAKEVKAELAKLE